MGGVTLNSNRRIVFRLLAAASVGVLVVAFEACSVDLGNGNSGLSALNASLATVLQVPMTVPDQKATVTPNEVLQLQVTGGTAPYTYSLESGGIGYVDPTAGFYQAPNAEGSGTVDIADSGGLSTTLTLTVSGQVDLDPPPAPTTLTVTWE